MKSDRVLRKDSVKLARRVIGVAKSLADVSDEERERLRRMALKTLRRFIHESLETEDEAQIAKALKNSAHASCIYEAIIHRDWTRLRSLRNPPNIADYPQPLIQFMRSSE